MTDKIDPKADASGAAPDALALILSAVQGLSARMDSMEKTMPAPSLVSAADKRKDDDDDKKKADDEEEAKKAESKKADDDKARKDAEGKEEGKSGAIKEDDDDKKADDDARKADEEAGKFADAQAKADSVMAAFGKSATRPMQGENLMAYRKRLLRGLQAYSDDYKGIDLKAIKDEALLSLAERKVYADAAAAARAPGSVADGQLIEMQERDRAGRTISKFRGSVESWLGAFKVPSQSGSFVTANNKR